jgi:hypothetical protein
MRPTRGIAAVLLAAGLIVSAGAQQKDGEKEAKLRPVPPDTGTLKGKITLKDAPPNLEALTKRLREMIDRKEEKDYCLKCAEFEKTPQAYRLGGPDNKQVGNVFVWIAPEPGTFFQITEEQIREAKKQEVALRLPHCAFVPHCLVLFPSYRDLENPRTLKPTGQVLKIINDGPICHNITWQGRGTVGDNPIIAPGKDRTVNNLVPGSSPVVFRCNIHPWMEAWLWVLDHPYAAISLAEPKVKKDDRAFGTYEIKNVPAGKVRLFAWHEQIGFLTKETKKGEPFELKDGEPTVRDFELEVPKEDQ